MVLVQKNSKKINKITTIDKIKKEISFSSATNVKTKKQSKTAEKQDKPVEKKTSSKPKTDNKEVKK